LAAHLKKLPGSGILARLEAAGVPCAPVKEVSEVIADPQVLARGMLLDMQYPGTGSMKLAGPPFKASGMETPQPARAPLLGEHTEEILAELSYSKAAIDSLEHKGVILKG
jgi:CoA:oxalate CoA-transferase